MIPCSTAAAGEPLAGTAPNVHTWIAIEHPGPWGRDAVADLLPQTSAVSGLRVLLIRRERTTTHRVFISHPALSRMTTLTIAHLRELQAWDFQAIAAGNAPGESTNESPILVCTTGSRDRCCATEGRALLKASPIDVWECTHVGGHRFAPVVVRLRDGYVFGRVGPHQLPAIAIGQTPAVIARGRSTLDLPAQAAEIMMRERGLDVMDVRTGPDPAVMIVQTATGPHHVRVHKVDIGLERPESCGADAHPVHAWHCTIDAIQ